MIIEELQFKIFENVEALKSFIEKNFNVVAMQERDNTEFEIDDEIDFMTDEWDYSVYYMKGNSGRVIVVETGAQGY